MQTFLPHLDFTSCAQCFDRQRLGKQRVEAKQIYLALTQPGYGWQNHPAVKMWRGHEYWLLQYGWEMCAEWIKRGYADTLQRWFDKQQGLHVPFGFGFTLDSKPDMPWLTPSFCLSHRSNLIRKLPSHYGPMWPDVPNNLPYIWPLCD